MAVAKAKADKAVKAAEKARREQIRLNEAFEATNKRRAELGQRALAPFGVEDISSEKEFAEHIKKLYAKTEEEALDAARGKVEVEQAELIEKIKGPLTGEDISTTDLYLQRMVEGLGVERTKKAVRVKGAKASLRNSTGKIIAENLAVLEGKADGHTYRAYEDKDSGRIYYNYVRLLPD